MNYRIYPPEEIIETAIDLPLSKSMALRAIAIAHLCGDIKAAEGLESICTDSQVLYGALKGGIPTDGSALDLADCGAALRFVSAIAASTPGAEVLITGTPRLCERPVGALVDALRELGADIEYRGAEGCAPLYIKGMALRGGDIEVDASISSQFVSALMLIAPTLPTDLTIRISSGIQSQPYIMLTAAAMRRAGAECEVEPTKIDVKALPYRCASIDIERDWSAAAFWYEIVAIGSAWLTLPGLCSDSAQPDRAATKLFECLGALTEGTDDGVEASPSPDLFGHLDADMTDSPDLVPALAVTAAMVGVPFRLSGVGALHHKECDRIAALRDELAKMGVAIYEDSYGTVIGWDGQRTPIFSLPEFDSHGDHRIAMALAPTAFFIPGIVVKDAEVVAKSYPKFWDDLQSAGFILRDPSEPLLEAVEE